MNSCIALTKNELEKILKQWSFRIILIIFAVLVAVIPAISYFSEKATADYEDGFDEEAIQYYLQNYETAMTAKDYSRAIWSKTSADALQYFMDLGLGRYSGCYVTYFDEYEYALYDEYLFTVVPYSELEALIECYEFDTFVEIYDEIFGLPDYFRVAEDGEPIPDEEDSSGVTGDEATDSTEIENKGLQSRGKISINVNNNIGNEGLLNLVKVYIAGSQYYEEDVVKLLNSVTEEEYLCMRNKCAEKRAEVESKIANYTVRDLYSLMAEDLANDCARNTGYLEESYNEYAIASTAIDKADANEKIRYYTNELEFNSLLSSAMSLLYEHESPYDGWEYSTYDMVENAAYYACDYYYVDEIDYRPEDNEGLAYADYVKEQNEKLEEIKLTVNEGLYSLEHGIPLNGSGGAMAKNKYETQLTLTGMVILIILAVLAGYIFAFEYSTGTVRLLLIRRQNRDKICLSKMAAVFIIGAGLALYSLIVLFIGDGLFFGFEGFGVNSIYIYGGEIHEIPSVVKLLIILAQDTISMLPLLMFSFLLSIICRKSPLSIAVTVIWYIAINLLQQLCTKLYAVRVRFLQYTVLPYFQLSYFRADPSIAFFSYYDLLTVLTEGITQDYIMHSYPWLGTAYLIALTGIFTFLCFFIFRRQEIKN